MARRGKSSIKPIWIVAAVILLASAFLGSQFLINRRGSFSTVPSLDVPSYMDNANSLRGNTYKVEGEVADSLAWSPSKGRLIAVNVEKSDDVVAIMVTPEFSHVNIQKGQRFIFLLEVDQNGVLVTKDLTKS